MLTIEPDPDVPDSVDRTMQRLELATELTKLYPGLANVRSQRDGTLLGHVLEPTSGPAGALLAELRDAGEDERPSVGPLAWHAAREYLILRTPEAPEVWVRALRAFPVSYEVEAFLWTRLIEPERGVRRWHVLDAEEQPVLLADSAGGAPRPWVLREDLGFDLDHDLENGWQVWARDTPEGTVPRPG